jgi:hypothetical protein
MIRLGNGKIYFLVNGKFPDGESHTTTTTYFEAFPSF